MPPIECECGAKKGESHRPGCLWHDEGRPDPMLIDCPHPTCSAKAGEACSNRRTSGTHMMRRLLSRIANDPKCIGRGYNGDGCGYRDGQSGDICPECGGMVLSAEAREQAEALAARMLNELHEAKKKDPMS